MPEKDEGSVLAKNPALGYTDTKFIPKGDRPVLAEYRRALHEIPELDWDVPETGNYLKKVLAKLDCRIFEPCPGAVCAYFDLGKPETMAVRGEMDALPLEEKTGLPFASRHPGKMHACGHDGHMAMALGLGENLSGAAKNLLLIFQPAEETTGGAKAVCDTGILEKYHVTEIYGIHLWPDLPRGTVAASPRGMMARSCEVTAEFTGRSAHIAKREEGTDALLPAAEFLLEAEKIRREFPCVLGFGKLSAGSARNAVADFARLEGTLRCHDDGIFYEIKKRLEKAAPSLCRLHFSTGYPPMENNEALLKRAEKLFPVEEAEPSFLTDDFSEYLRRVPGVFFRLGTGGPALHTPEFDFDEAVLDTGLSLYRSLLTGERL